MIPHFPSLPGLRWIFIPLNVTWPFSLPALKMLHGFCGWHLDCDVSCRSSLVMFIWIFKYFCFQCFFLCLDFLAIISCNKFPRHLDFIVALFLNSMDYMFGFPNAFHSSWKFHIYYFSLYVCKCIAALTLSSIPEISYFPCSCFLIMFFTLFFAELFHVCNFYLGCFQSSGVLDESFLGDFKILFQVIDHFIHFDNCLVQILILCILDYLSHSSNN